MPGHGRPTNSREVTKATVNLHDLIGSSVMVAISHSTCIFMSTLHIMELYITYKAYLYSHWTYHHQKLCLRSKNCSIIIIIIVISLLMTRGRGVNRNVRERTDTKQGTAIQSTTNSTLYNMRYMHHCACVHARNSKYLMHYIMD